jgi:hypothetical protein
MLFVSGVNMRHETCGMKEFGVKTPARANDDHEQKRYLGNFRPVS